jgi:single-stranded DNA-specific DHH superfamily exonuclease
LNRNLAPDWCQRLFTERPSFDFVGLLDAGNSLINHLRLGNQKFQFVIDSDLDGITSAAILYKFLQKFYPEIECTYSLHTGKQHGLSPDIKIDEDTNLVITPDAGVNDVGQCKALCEKGIDVICLDHHIIEQPNQFAEIVSCMDGKYGKCFIWWLFNIFSRRKKIYY